MVPAQDLRAIRAEIAELKRRIEKLEAHRSRQLAMQSVKLPWLPSLTVSFSSGRSP
jgi:50S ribosomal subunit-associated GTPase HflX